MARIDIAELVALAPGSRAEVAGRALHVDDGRARIADETGVVDVALGGRSAPPGSWVRCGGVWDGAALALDALEVLVAPIGERPPSQSDWVWLHEDEGRRLGLLRARAAMLRAVRAWLDERGFLEVETPLAVPSPGLDLHLAAMEVHGGADERWLITSPEYQMKRLLSAGLSRIYQICRCFRAGEVGARHQPEFTMLEWYRAHEGSDALMRDTEELVAAACVALRGEARIPLQRGGFVDLSPPWERLTVAGAFERFAGVRVEEVLPDEERFYLLLGTEIEPRLGLDKPVFLTEWPARMASLARLLPDRSDVADRFEAFVAGLELCNGFGELTDAREQRERLQRDQRERAARELPVYPIDERFLAALEEGMPPAGGNALGLDRLAMLLLGAERIDDVVAFSASRL